MILINLKVEYLKKSRLFPWKISESFSTIIGFTHVQNLFCSELFLKHRIQNQIYTKVISIFRFGVRFF